MAGCNGSLCFHGAFTKKADALVRQARRAHSFILSKFLGRKASSHRYVVATKDGSADFSFGAAKKSRKQRGE